MSYLDQESKPFTKVMYKDATMLRYFTNSNIQLLMNKELNIV